MYVGRPGPSPVLAALFAAGAVRAEDRILDLGCGDGRDAVALARWGCRHVTGLDRDPAALALARARATRARVGPRVRFVEGDARDLGQVFPEASFDAVWDGLLLNNLRGRDEAPHARGVARVAAPGALLALEFRVTRAAHAAVAPAASRALANWFRFGPPAATLIPEHAGRRAPPYARVVVQVGVRNARRAPAP